MESSTVQRYIRFVLLFLMLGLVGCSAPQVARDFKWDASPKVGVVVFSVAHDIKGGDLNQTILYLDGGVERGGVVASSANGQTPIIMPRRPNDFEDVQGFLHVVPLAPGKHRFTYWQISNGTGLRIFPRGTLAPLEFEVGAGEVIYVGAFHGHLQRGENVFGIEITGGGYVGLVNAASRDLALLGQRYPQFEGQVRAAVFPSGPWVADGVAPKLDPPMPGTR